MTPLEELANKLRTFWLRDIGATAQSISGTASDGSIALARTLFIPSAGGLVGINQVPTAPYALDVVGHGRFAGNLYARAGNQWSIGADGTPWGAIYASDLHVGNLIAENKIATTGGRILVSPSTKVILAMTAGATTIDVAANTLTSGDRIYLESTGKLEWMAVTSGATTITGGYRYSVTRNLNGAGAQTWAAGDAVVNTGQTGQGFIDLFSRYGIPANGQTATTRQGPTIVGNVRTGSTFDAIKERWAVGNLKGLYDYAATAYGLAAGDPTAAWFALDATNGLRMMQASAARVQLTAAGVFTINNSSGSPVFTFDSSTGAEFTLPLTLATTGGIYQGTGTFASPTTGLKIFNSGGVGKIAGYNTGTVQWYADTDGKLYAGAGNVWLDSSGVSMLLNTSYTAGAAVKWGSNVVIYGILNAGVNRLYLTSAQPGTGTVAEVNVQADGGSSGGGYGQINLTASGNGASGYLTLYSTGAHVLRGTLGFYGATSGTARLQATDVAGTPTLTLPTTTGTLALTSDVTTAVVGTSGTIAKFTGTNAVGNSILTESGAAISAAGALTLVGQSDTNQLVLKSYSTQTSPQILMQVSAGTELARLYVSSVGSVALGYQAGAGAGVHNVSIGYQALAAASTTTYSFAAGYRALGSLTGGGSNFAFGPNSMYLRTGGYDNIAIGNAAGYRSTADWALFIGTEAGQESTAVYGVVHLGYRAGKQHQTGDDCIFIGAQTGYQAGTWTGGGVTIIGGLAGNAASGASNTLIGYRSGQNAGTSTQLVAIGADTGKGTGVYTASYSVLIGSGAGYTGPGVGNTLIGQNAGYVATSANNVAIGYEASRLMTLGANNVAIGYQAGYSLVTNGAGVFIGHQAGYNETGANRLYIANTNTTTPLVYGLFTGTGAGLRITSQATDGTPLVVRGKASQTSTLQDWQDSGAAVLAYVSAVGKFVAATPTTGTASITLPAGTAPTAPVAGDAWQDSTRKAAYGFFAGVNQALVGCIFTGTADATVGNTLTETSIMPTGIGTLTLPASFWTIGKSVRIKLWGKMSKGTTSVTRKYTLFLGATTLKTNTTAAGTSALTDDGWQFDALITCRTTGATGTVYVQMKQYHYGVVDPILVGTATVTIDTTASALIDYKFQWSANDATNNMVTTNATVEVLQ